MRDRGNLNINRFVMFLLREIKMDKMKERIEKLKEKVNRNVKNEQVEVNRERKKE